MRITFGSYLTVSEKGEAGGLRNYILRLKSCLEKLGCQVSLFDMWTTSPLQDCEVFHLFAANLGTVGLGRMVKTAGRELVVTPRVDKIISPFFIRLSNAVVTGLPKIHSHLAAAKRLCDMADLVVVWSDAERDFISRSFDMDIRKMEIVPYGVDQSEYRADPSRFIRRFGNDAFVLSVGNLGGPRKNFLRLIEVAGSLGVQTYIIGPIPDNKYARDCVDEAEKYDNVHLPGFVDRELLLSAYAAADTYIQPSITEGVGIAILEAAVLGAKVVATKNGAPPYYLGEFAEYVDPTSERSIRRKLLVALKKEKTSDLRDHLISSFGWNHSARKLVAAYKRIVP